MNNRLIALSRAKLRTTLLIDFAKELTYPDTSAKDTVRAAAELADEVIAEIERYADQTQKELSNDSLQSDFDRMMEEVLGLVREVSK